MVNPGSELPSWLMRIDGGQKMVTCNYRFKLIAQIHQLPNPGVTWWILSPNRGPENRSSKKMNVNAKFMAGSPSWRLEYVPTNAPQIKRKGTLWCHWTWLENPLLLEKLSNITSNNHSSVNWRCSIYSISCLIPRSPSPIDPRGSSHQHVEEDRHGQEICVAILTWSPSQPDMAMMKQRAHGGTRGSSSTRILRAVFWWYGNDITICYYRFHVTCKI